MALKTIKDVISLDAAFKGMPYMEITTRPDMDLTSMDIAFKGMPYVTAFGPGSVYTRGDYANLPITTNDLEINYSTVDYDYVSEDDDVDMVSQTAANEYAIHQFKEYVSGKTSLIATWNGQSDIDCSTSTIYLQVYNVNSTTWETIDFDNSTGANTDFDLTAEITDLTDYKNADDVVTFRVYQKAQ